MISEATRVLRATNPFGTLGHHVPLHYQTLPPPRLRYLLAGVERRLGSDAPSPRARPALERARAAFH